LWWLSWVERLSVSYIIIMRRARVHGARARRGKNNNGKKRTFLKFSALIDQRQGK
jgi:hypothetical protein